MKTFQVLAIISFMALGACKKDKPAVDPFALVTLEKIQAVEAQLTANAIVIANTTADVLHPGAIIVYKTNQGTYGKLLLKQSAFADPTHRFIFDLVNYNADGTVKLSVPNVTIPLGYLCDLDSGSSTNVDGAQSFYYHSDALDYVMLPEGLGEFYVYSN